MVRLRRALAANPRALLAQGDTVTLTRRRSTSTSPHSSGSCGVERRRRSSRPWRSIRVRCSTACTSRRRPSRSGSSRSAPGSASWPSTCSAGSSSATARRDGGAGRPCRRAPAGDRPAPGRGPSHADAPATCARAGGPPPPPVPGVRGDPAEGAGRGARGADEAALSRDLQRAATRGRAAAAGALAAGRGAPPAADARWSADRRSWRGSGGGSTRRGAARGQVILVTGEAGVGKSRLLEEMTSAAVARGTRLLVGRAWETEQILPFQPWVEAFRTGRALTRCARRLTRRAELARLFPELGAGAALPAITAEGHQRLFETLDAVLADLCRVGPVVVVLEDLQWADEMSVRLLRLRGPASRRTPSARPVVARRGPAETPGRAPRRRATALSHVEHVALGALSGPARPRSCAPSPGWAARPAARRDRGHGGISARAIPS